MSNLVIAARHLLLRSNRKNSRQLAHIVNLAAADMLFNLIKGHRQRLHSTKF